MAIRSVKVARAYRELCRAAAETFAGDMYMQRNLRSQTASTLRQHVSQMSEQDMVNDIKVGIDFVKYQVVQASYQPDTDRYKAHLRQDIIQQGTIDLQPPPDPVTGKVPDM
mmetsp:Transcript_27340/g.41320  ORF Transcript_27340/g.41320 Transcript_27340/m.41320 type:complete len:111 (-) Transcript_27340:201-533(-)|eukprot:CAMPEP_0194752510 /NCGR_PEP_ID=MMETSP0323_2-20130528/6306_1 /TAXON_ID=2866 ORGANISM="Crypthecodinium cohnii, Strain Seligo" /NCGR_SAMPLE_ID=MMETSP0323_2 /ASSEMBLY_ACC=CAM_ASM_000346 /LENGTH=110 /DNA_ID=CAMNT_0039669491 /DNA_START=106 /DNA_END=438 /DNA_ORIENTATION=-